MSWWEFHFFAIRLCDLVLDLFGLMPICLVLFPCHSQVKAVFQVLQGFETSLLYWDSNVPGYCEKAGIYVTHLSLTGLKSVLNPFLFAATCLKEVELFVGKVRMHRHGIPTLDAFASSVDSWLTVSLHFWMSIDFVRMNSVSSK